MTNKDLVKQVMHGRTHQRDIQCDNCHKWFDLMKADVGWRKLENTFNNLNEYGNAWAKCPHCGFVN